MKKLIMLSFMLILTVVLTATQVNAIENEDDYIVENPLSEWNGLDIDIFKSEATNEFYTDIDASDYMWIGDNVVYYVAPTTGSDSNDGLTRTNPFKTLAAAIAEGDADIIRIIEDGWFDYDEGFGNSEIEQNLSIVGDADVDVTISTAGVREFEKTAAYTNVYEADVTVMLSVVDLNYQTNGGLYEEVESIELVETTPGSYFYESDVVYVHTFDSRVPDDNVKTFKDVRNLFVNGYYKIYLENLSLFGGNNYYTTFITSPNDGENMSQFVAKNVEFKYSLEGTSTGIKLSNTISLLQNVTISYTYGDNIVYEENSFGIEDQVNASYAGFGANDSERNASTAHGGSKVIRINSDYSSSTGPVIHDIETDTESWNIQTNAYDSKAIDVSRKTSYRVEDNAVMYNYKTSGNSITYDLHAIDNSIIYEYQSTYDVEDIQETLDGEIISLKMVDYQTNGGTKIYSETVVYGDILDLPNTPSIEGYTFNGWYEESTLENLFNFNNSRITEDIVLYASYVNGGNNGAITQTTSDVLSFIGIAWYWWGLGIAGVYYFGFTKKGRKVIGLK